PNFRPLRVRTMDGLAIVPERFLGEPFWVAAFSRALRPCVTIRVQTDTANPETLTTLFELGRPIPGTNLLHVGKQRTTDRQPPQDFRDFIPEMNNGQTASLLARIANCLLLPIDGFGIEIGNVALGTAQVPAKIVETSAFGVLFAVNYQTVLRQCDGAFLFEMDRRPLLFRNDEPRQPIHVQTKVMQLPQMDIGRKGPFVEHAQEMFGVRFNQCHGSPRTRFALSP